jgi:Putative zinc-finger
VSKPDRVTARNVRVFVQEVRQKVSGSPNDPVERLLSRSLRERRGETGEVCPDADLLAAWADGALDRPEAASLEQHASTCARCAQILSAVASSHPDSPDAPRLSIWTVWRAWRWAVPMATAVVVMGLWFGSTREEVTRPAQAPLVQEPQSSPQASTAPRTPASPRAVPAPPPEATKAVPKSSEPSFAPERESKAENTVQAPEGRADAREAKDVAAEEASEGRRQAVAAPATLPPASPPPPTRPELADAARSRQAEQPRDASPQVGAMAGARASRLEEAQQSLLVRSPDPNTLWRGRGAAIERSTDGGTTWRVEYASGSPIAGGAAVSADVAWFFARGGLVLRRTPAGWLVSRLPGDPEIASINAVSGNEATVTLVGGRQLRTTDGGSSWVNR